MTDAIAAKLYGQATKIKDMLGAGAGVLIIATEPGVTLGQDPFALAFAVSDDTQLRGMLKFAREQIAKDLGDKPDTISSLIDEFAARLSATAERTRAKRTPRTSEDQIETEELTVLGVKLGLEGLRALGRIADALTVPPSIVTRGGTLNR
jgi:hypothetical protein